MLPVKPAVELKGLLKRLLDKVPTVSRWLRKPASKVKRSLANQRRPTPAALRLPPPGLRSSLFSASACRLSVSLKL